MIVVKGRMPAGPTHVIGADVRRETAVDRLDQIGGLGLRDRRLGGWSLPRFVGGPDKGEFAFVGNGKDDAAIRVLQQERMVSVIEPGTTMWLP
jgi:hypothetical protein